MAKQVKCKFPGGFKPRQKRHRQTVSNSYEEKIDEISSKLDDIRSAIDAVGLSSRPVNGDNEPNYSQPVRHLRGTWTPPASSYTRDRSPLTAANQEDLSEAESEGHTPLKSHAAYAADLVAQMVSNTSGGLTPEVTSSLDALQKIVQTSRKQRATRNGPASPYWAAPTTPESIKMPPLETAMMCLGMLKDHETIKYLCLFEVESVGEFVEYLPSCYSKRPLITDLMIVNAGLARFLHCCSCYESDAELRSEYEQQAVVCNRNLEIVVSQLSFAAPHTFDLALALSLASTQYMELARPRTAWKLIVHAAHVCQSLGFNRGEHQGLESSTVARRRRRLFLVVCLMEKTLAFCLGKASMIRSSEIPVLDVGILDGHAISLDPLWRKWIAMSLLQDQVYDDLCSPRALAQPDGPSDVRARALAEEMKRLFDTQDLAEMRCMESIRDAVGETVADVFWRSMRISGLAMLTLIYRTIPRDPGTGSGYSDLCISAAVEALDEHQQCMRLLDGTNHSMLDFYVQWALLSAPFVPYIVVFCLAVETSSRLYLSKLASVVEATERVASTCRDVYEKQLAIFRLMYDVACKCVEARSAAAETTRWSERSIVQGLESSANASLTVPSSSVQLKQPAGVQGLDLSAPSMVNEHPGSLPGGNGLSLGDWMDQNYQIFQLLDDDLMIDWEAR
ncbi:hypothetical protein O9K51_05075 [Purpureocillium lavendulum]|uniref:Xylanolytic transcriptional activator regulatory domain-containing protein n=1 Tax=Purpureocillium lavendulum TaxID=1247861 RepID=A0AB34FQY2_9HYPO|nr:hypothetical protein O9K51_05075 [Purpureocillium lavendulum]